jgi:coenzyme F420 hydrogenase subunit beta
VALARKQNARLDRNLGLVLSFFCAGTPSTAGTKALLSDMDVPIRELSTLRYRGNGWPGRFAAGFQNDTREATRSYLESWGFLQRYRPFRCHLCPDGLGQISDISCGDAWHRYADNEADDGRSLLLVRTERGRGILQRAVKAGYMVLSKSESDAVRNAQVNLLGKRKQLFGRLMAMKILGVPTPRLRGFSLSANWMRLSTMEKTRTVLGTIRRVLSRGLWHRNPLHTE